MPAPNLKINKELLQLFGLGDALDNGILLQYERQLIAAYQKAKKSIVGQISAMYERYGDNVTYDEMASFNRLTNLEQQINEQLKTLGISTKTSIGNSIKSSYQTSYQYSGFAMERALQVKMGFGLLSEKQVQAVFLNPLKHIKWTDSEKANIISTQLDLRNKIADGLIQGKGFATTASEVKDSLNTSFNRSMRIIQTETHRVQVAGRLAGMDQGQKAIDELGLDSQRMWLPALDAKTRPNHGAMDGKPAKVQEDGSAKFSFITAQGNLILVPGPGLTGTTDDINCRCSVFIQFEDFPIDVRKDNETKKIIPQKTYKEWYKSKYGKDPKIPKTPEGGSKLSRALNKAERNINKKAVEHVSIFSRGGDLLLSKKGERTLVPFNEKESRLFSNAILTHNHPNYASLSFGDMRTLMETDLYEMRAVTPTGHFYSIKKGRGFIKPDRRQLQAIEGIYNDALYENQEKYQPLWQSGKLQKFEARVLITRGIWKDIAKRLKIIYLEGKI